MKWISHKFLTGSLVFAATGDPLISCMAAIGSIIPDAVEGSPKDAWNYGKWRKRHRHLSHWFVPYLVIFFLSQSFALHHGLLTITFRNMLILFYNPDTRLIFISMITAFFMIGAMLHIAEDALCGKVPGFLLEERIGTKWFCVGSLTEYITVFPLGMLLIWTRLHSI